MDATDVPNCFWCGRKRCRLVRNRVVPRVAGGGDCNNVVPSCQRCLDERSSIQTLDGSLRRLRQRIERWNDLSDAERAAVRELVRLAVMRVAGMEAAIHKWVGIERRRWGDSPMAALDLTLPPIPFGVR